MRYLKSKICLCMRFEWQNVCIYAGKNDRDPNSTIISNNSGNVSSGEVLAIVGDSHGRNTELMKLLIGTVGNGRKTTGKVLVDENERNNGNWLENIGYVLGSDLMLLKFTAYETVRTVGEYKTNLSSNLLNQRIDYLFRILNLEQIKYKTMDDLSAKEFHKVVLASQLVFHPKILFVDLEILEFCETLEDKENLKKFMHKLKKLCINESIALVISASLEFLEMIFPIIDRITILKREHSLFHGTTQECIEYFTTNGFTIDLKEENYLMPIKEFMLKENDEIDQMIEELESKLTTNEIANKIGRPVKNSDPFNTGYISFKEILKISKEYLKLRYNKIRIPCLIFLTLTISCIFLRNILFYQSKEIFHHLRKDNTSRNLLNFTQDYSINQSNKDYESKKSPESREFSKDDQGEDMDTICKTITITRTAILLLYFVLSATILFFLLSFPILCLYIREKLQKDFFLQKYSPSSYLFYLHMIEYFPVFLTVALFTIFILIGSFIILGFTSSFIFMGAAVFICFIPIPPLIVFFSLSSASYNMVLIINYSYVALSIALYNIITRLHSYINRSSKIDVLYWYHPLHIIPTVLSFLFPQINSYFLLTQLFVHLKYNGISITEKNCPFFFECDFFHRGIVGLTANFPAHVRILIIIVCIMLQTVVIIRLSLYRIKKLWDPEKRMKLQK